MRHRAARLRRGDALLGDAQQAVLDVGDFAGDARKDRLEFVELAEGFLVIGLHVVDLGRADRDLFFLRGQHRRAVDVGAGRREGPHHAPRQRAGRDQLVRGFDLQAHHAAVILEDDVTFGKITPNKCRHRRGDAPYERPLIRQSLHPPCVAAQSRAFAQSLLTTAPHSRQSISDPPCPMAEAVKLVRSRGQIEAKIYPFFRFVTFP